MFFDLYVDTSRKGISLALSSQDKYEEIINPAARGETLSASLDSLMEKTGITLDDIKRVMVTLGPGSFSGLRTGVAFCQGICFSGKRKLYGVTTLQALECFGYETTPQKTAVIIRARNEYWYMRINEVERFIGTEEVVSQLKQNNIKNIVADQNTLENEIIKNTINELQARITLDTTKPLNYWAPLFESVKPSLIQEANYIQPSYFEKIKV